MQAAVRRKAGHGLESPHSPTYSGDGKPGASRAGRRSPRKLLRSNLVFVLGAFALVAVRFLLYHFIRRGPDTLVVYVVGFDDPEAINNIDFFLKHGVRENDGAYYTMAVKPDYQAELVDIPITIPHHVEIVRPSSRCFTTGLVGWVLRHAVDISRYKYIVWLDSSMRGPFLPTYVQDMQVPWHRLLTQRLDAQTKLVGGTISCSGVKLNVSHPTYFQPHVQGNLVATDQVGIKLLLEDSGALECHTKWLTAVRFSEIGSSEVILNAGYNIGSLMLRYASVDFRDKSKWNCNGRVNPMMQHTYDGHDLHPLEVMFVKALHHHVVTGQASLQPALKYEEWSQQNITWGAEDINSNAFKYMSEVYLDDLVAKGPRCFDHELYISAAPAEFEGYDAERAWLHFIMFGYREGRPYRFAC